MKTINLTIITLLLLAYGCTNKSPKNEQTSNKLSIGSTEITQNTPIKKASLLNSEILEKQTFKVSGKKTVKLTSKGGVKLTIAKNTFVDAEGNAVEGDIEIEYKEALNPTDIVLGNMTTTHNGKFLESGGMVYVNATANGEQLSIADNKSIDFDVPAKARKKGMMLFEGKEENGKINWVEPKKIDDQILALNNIDAPMNNRVMEYIEYDSSKKHDKAADKAWRKVYSPKFNNVTDTTIKVDGYKFHYYVDTLGIWGNGFSGSIKSPIKGTNTFAEDQTASYVFKVKKLGWANIDRLFSDPRTKDVKFITKIDEPEAFDNVYISILFPKQNMYIPGYQKKDGTFSFTHGDYEPPKFPIGEKAIILATGYKNDVPFYALKKVIIAKEQTVSLNLEETTKEELKRALKATL